MAIAAAVSRSTGLFTLKKSRRGSPTFVISRSVMTSTDGRRSNSAPSRSSPSSIIREMTGSTLGEYHAQHEVKRAAVSLGDGTGLEEGVILEERSIANRLADSNEILHYYAPGAEVEMPDLAIAHLALG